MSGSIQEFKKENEELFNKKEGDLPETENIAITLTGYEDDKYFVGQRKDTKEMIKIHLRPVEQKGKYERIGIEKLSNEKDYKNYVKPGVPESVLLFESCYQEEDGTWNSRWVNVLSKEKKPARVFVMTSSLTLANYQDSKFFVVNAIKSVDPVTEINDLQNKVIEGLRPKMPKMTPAVAIRFTDNIGDSIIHKVFAKKEVVNDVKEVMQPENYIQDIFSNERFQKLTELLNKPGFKVEVMSLTSMTFGADTNSKMISNAYEINKMNTEYKDEQGNDLYKDTILTLRERDNGSLFLISSSPKRNNVKGVRLEDL